MKNGMVLIIMWVTTHNATLCLTTTVPIVVRCGASKSELQALSMSLCNGNNTVLME